MPLTKRSERMRRGGLILTAVPPTGRRLLLGEVRRERVITMRKEVGQVLEVKICRRCGDEKQKQCEDKGRRRL